MWQTRGDEKLMRRVHGQRQVREWVADGRGSEDAGGECGGIKEATLTELRELQWRWPWDEGAGRRGCAEREGGALMCPHAARAK